MVLEVNNTFDERRIYFLKDTDSDSIDRKESREQSPRKFANTWTKDFHVSPFNSRKGSYSLLALDPFSSHLNGKGPVDNTITLSSSKGHPKLVARVFSTSKSLDPNIFTKWDILKFFAAWWWVGFVTFPRIVREAGKLSFRRKLHVWYRPEVLKESIGRIHTPEERAIEPMFRNFLKSQAENSVAPLPVKYVPAMPTDNVEEIFTPAILQSGRTSPQEILLFKPTTPLFYAKFACSTNESEFIASEVEEPDIKKHTFYSSHPNLLAAVFVRSQRAEATGLSLIDRPPWTIISILRMPRPQLNNDASHHSKLSALDRYAISCRASDPVTVDAYRRATLKLLISEHIAFGLVPAVDGVIAAARIWLCWLCAQSLVKLLQLDLRSGQTDNYDVGKLAIGCLGVHIWWWLGRLL